VAIDIISQVLLTPYLLIEGQPSVLGEMSSGGQYWRQDQVPNGFSIIYLAGHNYIGTEHLLLGLLREGEGVAARVLENLGADPSNIRTQVIRMVGESTESVGAGVGVAAAATKCLLWRNMVQI